MKATSTLAGVIAAILMNPVAADEREELLKLKNTTVNLIDALVQQGILDKDKAKNLISSAESKAATEAKQQRAEEEKAQKKGLAKAKDDKSVHVAYVPEFVKEDIRKQVRAELKDDVLKDVKEHAKQEKWGIPDALPEWISRIHPYADMRLRIADDFFDPANAPAFDWLQINKDGGLSQALAKNDAFLNTTIDRLRLRERFRVGFDMDITEGLKAGFRFATSNQFNPVSNNQTLGNTGQSYQFAIDRAFLQYDFKDKTGNDWFSLYGGRIPNPFVSTDVVFDPDLSFEGFAGTFRLNLDRDDPVVKSYRVPNPIGRAGINQGPQHPNSVFATLGAFPLQEVNLSSADKWLFGMQLGADWLVYDESRLKFAASYYDYKNVAAQRNSLDSLKFDWTAPQFIQKGNSLVAINDAKNQTACNTGTLGAQNVCLVGLASDFQIFNATASFDYAGFAPVHVMLTGDYAKNLGFNPQKILAQFGDHITPRTDAYQVRLDVGNSELRRFNDWSLYAAYRYIQRDAVLDAFTDSVFHQGGTDAKGWVLGAQYGLASNTWLNLRWFSTDSIDGPPLSIDTATLDLNARF
jgi:hypothetical protein